MAVAESPVASASSQRFHSIGATSYAGSPASGFGSIDQPRLAGRRPARWRSAGRCGSASPSVVGIVREIPAPDELAWSTNRRGTRLAAASSASASAQRAACSDSRLELRQRRPVQPRVEPGDRPRRPRRTGSRSRSWPGSARSSSSANRRGSARSSRTAPVARPGPQREVLVLGLRRAANRPSGRPLAGPASGPARTDGRLPRHRRSRRPAAPTPRQSGVDQARRACGPPTAARALPLGSRRPP